MTLLMTILLVWGGLLLAGVAAGSALGLVARRTDDANDRDLARGLDRQHAAASRIRERAGEQSRRDGCLPAPGPVGEVATGVHATRSR